MAWTARDADLTWAEMEGNAYEVYYTLDNLGWTPQAVAAVCGNMQAESQINPGRWEIGKIPFSVDAGYGLTQWTPYIKLSDWADQNQLAWIDNGDTQVLRIEYEALNNEQWFYNVQMGLYPPISFTQFRTSTLSVDNLSDYFLYFYEHPGDPVGETPVRRANSRYWYNLFTGGGGGGGIPIWLLFKMSEFNRKGW